jgi:hypothetical protein
MSKSKLSSEKKESVIVRVSKLSCMWQRKLICSGLWTHMWRNRVMMVRGAGSREAAKATAPKTVLGQYRPCPCLQKLHLESRALLI